MLNERPVSTRIRWILLDRGRRFVRFTWEYAKDPFSSRAHVESLLPGSSTRTSSLFSSLFLLFADIISPLVSADTNRFVLSRDTWHRVASRSPLVAVYLETRDEACLRMDHGIIAGILV